MKKILFTCAFALVTLGLAAGEHPSLMLTKKGVAAMRADRGEVPAFDASLARTLAGAEAAVDRKSVV